MHSTPDQKATSQVLMAYKGVTSAESAKIEENSDRILAALSKMMSDECARTSARVWCQLGVQVLEEQSHIHSLDA